MIHDMNPTHKAMIELLREQGYAVVAVPPDPLKCPHGEDMQRDDLEGFLTRMAERRLRIHQEIQFSKRIVAATEFLDDPRHCGPFVAVVWGGRDCDGVQYNGEVHLVPANPKDVEEHIEHTYKWADGPCDYAIMKPSEAEKIEYESRDLTMEAFENGRTYDITPGD